MAVLCPPAWCLLKGNQVEQAPDGHKYGIATGTSYYLSFMSSRRKKEKKKSEFPLHLLIQMVFS